MTGASLTNAPDGAIGVCFFRKMESEGTIKAKDLDTLPLCHVAPKYLRQIPSKATPRRLPLLRLRVPHAQQNLQNALLKSLTALVIRTPMVLFRTK